MSERAKWLLIGGLGSLLVLVLGFLLVINPAMGRLDEVNKAVEAQNSNNQQMAAKLAQLKQQVAEVPAKMQEIEAVKAKMPTTMEQPALVRSLETAASAAGVDLTNIGAATPVAVEGSPGTTELTALPYTMNATGTYSALKTFVSELERLPRAFLITNLNIGGGDEELGELSMDLNGKFYALQNYDVKAPENLPPAEAAPAPAPAAEQPPETGQAAAKAPKKASKKASGKPAGSAKKAGAKSRK